MSVYEDSGWYEAAGKLEPQLGTAKGLSTELVITRGEEARKRLEELAAQDLLLNEFHFELFDPCYSHQDSIVKFAIRHHELMEKHKETTFPRSSQNQTVSSGVEGAHEGTTADKTGPEKLNNAQKADWCECGHVDDDHSADGCEVSDQFPDSGCECTKFRSVALAESSLSSPPPEVCPICGTLDYGCCPSVVLGDPWLCRKPQRRDFGDELADMVKAFPTIRQSSSPSEPGPESAHSGKQNTADKSELLPTQLPPDKS